VQRCGGKPCNCSPQEKAAHAAVQPPAEEQAQTTSGTTLASLQRDADDDDDTDDGGAAPTDQGGGANAADADGGAGQSASAPDQASATPNDQDATQTADASSGQTTDDTVGDTGGGDQSTATDQSDGGQAADTADSTDSDVDAADVEPVPPVSGQGEQREEEVFGGSINLQGRTNASFGNSFTTTTIHTTPGDASACGCEAANCVHISGTLTSTFTMSTHVSLPSPPAGATPRQRAVAQYLIDNCISPHEQQHVTAFNAYQGTVRTPFDLSCCRADVNSSLQAIHDGVEQTRHDSAQTTSDNLDPFNATFDPDCADDADMSSCITCPTP
jgi:hypothetical protein